MLTKVRLTKGWLTKVWLTKVRLTKVRLTKARLTKARLTKVRLTKVRLRALCFSWLASAISPLALASEGGTQVENSTFQINTVVSGPYFFLSLSFGIDEV